MIRIEEQESWNLNNIQRTSREEFLIWINEKNKLHDIVACPFCKSNNLVEISNVDRFGLSFKALQCKDCNLVSTSPQIKEEYLPEYYDKFYHPLIFGETEAKDFLFNSTQGEKIYKLISKYIPNSTNNLRIFEVGAGSGSNLKGFSEYAKKFNINCSLEGLEYSTTYVEKAKKDNIILYTNDLNSYVKKTKSKFDIIILSHVFEHVTQPVKFLESIKKLMHENTILYIEVPGILSLHKNQAYRGLLKRYLVHAHIYHFTAESLERMLIKNGFIPEFINENVESVFKINNTNIEIALKHTSNIPLYLYNLNKYKIIYKILFYIKKVRNKLIG